MIVPALCSSQENQGSLSKFMRQELLHQGTLVTQAIRNQHMKFKGHLRKAVTGDEKKRVRDHVRYSTNLVGMLR
jgi:hypothetical protein